MSVTTFRAHVSHHAGSRAAKCYCTYIVLTADFAGNFRFGKAVNASENAPSCHACGLDRFIGSLLNGKPVGLDLKGLVLHALACQF